MALIDRKRNFIFIHIYKTGGNSLREVLDAPTCEEILGVHVEAQDVRDYLRSCGDEEFWNNAFKFTMVRNPYSWLVSTYEYIKRSKGHNYHDMFMKRDFDFFVHWIINTAMKMDRPFGSNKYLTQTAFATVDGKMALDKIYRMEEFNVAIQDLKRRFGININKIPHKNANLKSKPFESYYNPNLLRLVNAHFGDDLKNFDYAFPTKGFSGDLFLRNEIAKLISKHNIKTIIETGTYHGETTKELSLMTNKVFTIEINDKYHAKAQTALQGYDNVVCLKGNSPELLNKIIPTIKGSILFYLDAHWYNYCPLLDEIKTIAKHHKSDSIIVIHDFKVPGTDFGFDSYKNQPYEWDWIAPAIKQVYGDKFERHYNSQAAGSRRGVIFIEPRR